MLPKQTYISNLLANERQTGRKFDSQTKIEGICILGATGSIGTQTLDIVRLFPDRLKVVALTAGKNAPLLAEQALLFSPQYVVIEDESQVPYLEARLKGTQTQVLCGSDALCEVVSLPDVDKVIAAMVGFAGLKPTVAAIRAKKTVALANKETLVVAGAIMQALVAEHETSLLPIDSEHSAIFQCLVGEEHAAIEELILTASGGPFRMRDKATFAQITKAEALKHPNWTMGAKITIDSATMMNKGLEIIEAKWLFDLDASQIKVLVHPQSIIHSMVAFKDGSTKAQLGIPDMKVPIQYALTFPHRWQAPHERLDWTRLATLDFEQPDFEKFPCLRLAFDAMQMGGTAPAVMNAANEQAVALFLEEKIGFTEIPARIEKAMDAFASSQNADLDELFTIDQMTRRFIKEHKPILML